MSTHQDWFARLKAEEQERRERLPAAKKALLAALKRSRARRVTIDYDGEGDSGQIGEVAAESATGRPVDLVRKITLNLRGEPYQYATLQEALEDFAWVVLAVYHSGFENNEGGFGTLSFDVRKGTVTLEHNDRIIEVSTSLTEV
jgi:hypothetical protein